MRPVGQGETRVAARLRAIDCHANGVIVIVLEAPGRTVRVAAERFDAIDFITYRDTVPGSVTCGVIARPLPVLATYRAADQLFAGTEGRVVAIELVPDGYTAP